MFLKLFSEAGRPEPCWGLCNSPAAVHLWSWHGWHCCDTQAQGEAGAFMCSECRALGWVSAECSCKMQGQLSTTAQKRKGKSSPCRDTPCWRVAQLETDHLLQSLVLLLSPITLLNSFCTLALSPSCSGMSSFLALPFCRSPVVSGFGVWSWWRLHWQKYRVGVHRGRYISLVSGEPTRRPRVIWCLRFPICGIEIEKASTCVSGVM